MNSQQQTTNGHAPSGARPLREKVNFEVNVPRLIGLEFDPPAEAREGRFGDQYMYFLANNEILWADPPLHEAIVASGARKGDELAVCKREVRTGNRKRIQWEATLQQTNQDESEEQQRAEWLARNGPAPAPAPPPPPPPPLASQPRPPVEPAKPTGTTPKTNRGVLMTGNLMAAALRQAMEACAEADYTPAPGDVRTLAITIYISATGGGKSK